VAILERSPSGEVADPEEGTALLVLNVDNDHEAPPPPTDGFVRRARLMKCTYGCPSAQDSGKPVASMRRPKLRRFEATSLPGV